MKYKRRFIVKVTPWLVKWIITLLFILFVVGGITGYTICKVSTPGEECTTTSIESTTIVEVIEVTTSPIPTTVEPIEPYYDCPLNHDVQDYIRDLCEKNNIPMSLVIAIIDVESSFRPNAVSKTNDYGLMQINKCNHKWLEKQYGITNFFDPYENIFCGITILSQKYGGVQSLDKTLMAYNLGLTKATKLWSEGIYQTSYSKKVLSKMEVYDAQI